MYYNVIGVLSLSVVFCCHQNQSELEQEEGALGSDLSDNLKIFKEEAEMKIKTKTLVIAAYVIFVLALTLVFVLPGNGSQKDTSLKGRDILSVDSNNSLSMKVNSQGVLTWNAVYGASGYRVVLMRQDGTQIRYWNVQENFTSIVSDMDNFKYDSGEYAFQVEPQGAGESAEMSYFYTSNVEKLEDPHNLQWTENEASWEEVEGASSYDVALYSFSQEVVRTTVTEGKVDFSEYAPQDGWTFKVCAQGDGTISDKRDSNYVESPKKGIGTRPVLPVESDNLLNMSIDENGILTWDEVEDASVYHVMLFSDTGAGINSWEVSESWLPLITEMDSYKYDSGRYVLKVEPDVGESAFLTFYYTSHVEQFEAPRNLQWIGTQASWDPVEGAACYNVILYGFSKAFEPLTVTEESIDFSEYAPQDGWTFKVQAVGDGSLLSKRNSKFAESPAYYTSIYNVSAYVYNGTLDEYDSGGQVYIKTELGINQWSFGGGIQEAPSGGLVTFEAKPEEGYKFVEWRQAVDGEAISIRPSYRFVANGHNVLYAVFEVSNDITYTIECNAYDVTNTELMGGTVIVQTDHGASDGQHFKGEATEDTTVIVSALADFGYEFVEWRYDDPQNEENFFAKYMNYAFKAEKDLRLYAVFRKLDIPQHLVAYACGNGIGYGEITAITEGSVIELKKPSEVNIYPLAGMEFDYWAVFRAENLKIDSKPEKKKAGNDIIITRQTFIVAVWKEIHYSCIGNFKKGRAATCAKDGWKDYYQCQCGKYYADEDCRIPINDLKAWRVGAGKLSVTHSCDELIEEILPVHTDTLLVNGMKAHYYCDICDIYFDENKVITTLSALTVSVSSHAFGDLITEDGKHLWVCHCGFTLEAEGSGSNEPCHDIIYSNEALGEQRERIADHALIKDWEYCYFLSCGGYYQTVHTIGKANFEVGKDDASNILTDLKQAEVSEKMAVARSVAGMQGYHDCPVCNALSHKNRAEHKESDSGKIIDANAQTLGFWSLTEDGSQACLRYKGKADRKLSLHESKSYQYSEGYLRSLQQSIRQRTSSRPQHYRDEQ